MKCALFCAVRLLKSTMAPVFSHFTEPDSAIYLIEAIFQWFMVL